MALSVSAPGSRVDELISREELLRRLRDPGLVIVDVLPRESFAACHIRGAVNLPLADVQERATEILPDRDAELAVYCAGPS